LSVREGITRGDSTQLLCDGLVATDVASWPLK
jgi:hypothetical protein